MKHKVRVALIASAWLSQAAYAEEVPKNDPLASTTEQKVMLNDSVSAWFSSSNSDVESDRPGLEYDGDIETTSIGLEWSHSKWAVGAALSYSEGAFEGPGSSDERDERKTQFMPYVTWKVVPGIQLRAFAGISEGEFSRTRHFAGTADTFSGETDTRGTMVGLSAFLFAPVGPGMLSTAFTVVEDKTRFDEFEEEPSDPANFPIIDSPSFRQRATTVSAQARYFVNLGKLTPYVSLSWFEHTSSNLNETDPSGWTWGGGLAFTMAPRARLAVQYQQLEDKDFEENRTLSGQFIFTF
jgi:opacity protein-like surface antigen